MTRPSDEAIRSAISGRPAVEWNDPPGLVPAKGTPRNGCRDCKKALPVSAGSTCSGCKLIRKERAKKNRRESSAIEATRKRQERLREKKAEKRRSTGEFNASPN